MKRLIYAGKSFILYLCLLSSHQFANTLRPSVRVWAIFVFWVSEELILTQVNKVENGVVVAMAYSLHLDDGEMIDSAPADAPLTYLHGHQNIIPGLERELTGLTIGDEKDVAVAPADGYGEYDEDAKQLIATNLFPDDIELEEGMALQLQDDDGNVHQAFVDNVQKDQVLIDFNHPLAGRTLHFNVKIVELRAATAEEIAHSHVHDDEHVH